MLHVSQRQIRKAFFQNAKAARALQGSHDTCKSMLAFYSAECGLKYVIMSINNFKSTGDLPKTDHDLRKLLRDAAISPSELGESPNIPDLGCENRVISTSDWHTAWRYGAEIAEERDGAAYSFLVNVISALQKRLGG